MEQKAQFGVVDFIVFIGMLLLTIVIGGYHAFKDRKNETVENYYFGGKNMSPIPVGLSIAVTFISALSVISFPTEVYLFGTVIFWFCFTVIIPIIVACVFHIPLVHRLQLISLYKYLELRFDKRLRQLASTTALITMMIYMSITVYIPGLALNAVTPLGLKWTIALTSVICTVYTSMGGMKAVVWADTFQTFIMLAGALAALIKTTMIVGGFENIWLALERGERLNFWNFNPDPTLRNSFWTIIIGSAILSCNPNQAITQRYLSCDSIKTARIAAVLSIFPHILFSLIAILTGCAMYAYYEGCDPLMKKEIKQPDQLMPYLVVNVFQDQPGIAGLFISAAFSATMSTVSSGINSLAALVLEDFIIPKYPKLGPRFQVTISKLTVLSLGFLVMCLAFCFEYLPGTIMQIGFTLGGTLGGPVLAIYTLGMFFPWANTKGAFIGQIVSTLLTMTLAVCGIIFGKSPAHNRALPASIEKCTDIFFSNATTHAFNESTLMMGNVTTNAIVITQQTSSIQDTLFALSFIHYGTFALIVGVFVGLIASFITGANKPSEADPKLFFPLIDNKIFPAAVRKFFRFGVPHLTENKDYNIVAADVIFPEQDYFIKETNV